ncbi:hypothetical protein FB451DRAFT_1557006 [Mycena latifolia]|nr:hypothetical protein FB451DRAFT_1557006 [Mycena latifolia]
MAMSLLSNFTATGVVGATAWGHYRTIRSTFSEGKASSLTTNRILLLVVESGVLYCLSAVLVLVASLIRLPQGTLGDLHTPMNVQIAVNLFFLRPFVACTGLFVVGAYPCVVLILGSIPSEPIHFGTLGSNSTDSAIDNAQKAIPIHFARNPALSGMSGTDSEALEISPIRPSAEKSRQNRRFDDSFV